MKIHLDTEKCQGHGRCYSLAPDLFDCDDLGTAVVVVAGDLNDEQLAKAKLAAGNCRNRVIVRRRSVCLGWIEPNGDLFGPGSYSRF
jgi:ferredoxin